MLCSNQNFYTNNRRHNFIAHIMLKILTLSLRNYSLKLEADYLITALLRAWRNLSTYMSTQSKNIAALPWCSMSLTFYCHFALTLELSKISSTVKIYCFFDICRRQLYFTKYRFIPLHVGFLAAVTTMKPYKCGFEPGFTGW